MRPELGPALIDPDLQAVVFGEPLDRGGDPREVARRRETMVAGFDQLHDHILGCQPLRKAQRRLRGTSGSRGRAGGGLPRRAARDPRAGAHA
jgi:hypothetical protein